MLTIGQRVEVTGPAGSGSLGRQGEVVSLSTAGELYPLQCKPSLNGKRKESRAKYAVTDVIAQVLLDEAIPAGDKVPRKYRFAENFHVRNLKAL